MFYGLRKKAAQKKILQACMSHQPKGVKKVKNIGIIVDPMLFENPEEMKTLLRAFKPISKFIKMIAVEIKASQSPIIYDDLVFVDRQVSWLGKFKSETDAYTFQQQSYSLLINYFTNPSLPLLLLSAETCADLKIGFPTKYPDINDLNIVVNPTEINRFVLEIQNYLPKINQPI